MPRYAFASMIAAIIHAITLFSHMPPLRLRFHIEAFAITIDYMPY